MKKRRYRRRRYMRRKTYRRRRTRAEIKYCTIAQAGMGVLNSNVANTTLSNTNLFGTASNEGILSAITQGAGANQRIGSKITIRAIRIRGVMWLCPASGDTTVMTSATVRMMAGAFGSYAGGSDLSNFWPVSITNHTHDYPYRSDYRLYLDKTIRIHDSYGSTGATRAGKGNPVPFNFKLKFRGPVEYKFNLSSMRDSLHRINFANIGFCPHLSDAAQIACCNYTVRMYFTDV